MKLALSAWVLAVGLGIVSGAHAEEIVVPNANALVEGEVDNVIPFGAPDGNPTFAEARYQQVYAASQFPPAPLLITEIRFRPDGPLGIAFSATLPSVVVMLSTTGRPLDNLSVLFASNLGLDATIVFQGNLSLSSNNTGSPKAFDVVIPLSTPFLYDPCGGNLLLDILKPEASSGPVTRMDTVHVFGDPVSRVFRLIDATTPIGSLPDSAGLVTQFIVEPPPPDPSAPPPPPNDDFADAKKFPLPRFCDFVDTRRATAEPEDPTDCAAAPAQTVWYCHTATADGLIEADTCGSGYDTVLAVYEDVEGVLTLVACSDDDDFCVPLSRVAFEAVEGATYYFLVSGRCGGVLFFCAREVLPPPNDDLLDAKTIPTRPSCAAYCDVFDTRAATTEPGEPVSSCGAVDRTVWFKLTPEETRHYEATTCGSDYDTVVAVYEATAVPGVLAPVECNDDGMDCGPASQAFFTAEAGRTYFIQVGGKPGDPDGNLDFCLQLTEPDLPVCGSKETSLLVAAPGDTITYEFRFDNCASPVAAEDVFFTDVPPAGTTFVPDSFLVDGMQQAGEDPAVGVDLGTIDADTIRTVSFQVEIEDPGPPVGSELRNSASFTYTFVPLSGGMPVMGSRTTNDVFTVIPFDPTVTTWRWDGPAIGGMWDDPANWSEGSVPTGASLAHIDGEPGDDSTVTVTDDRAVLEVLLDHGDKLVIESGASLGVFAGLATFADDTAIMLAGGMDGDRLLISQNDSGSPDEGNILLEGGGPCTVRDSSVEVAPDAELRLYNCSTIEGSQVSAASTVRVRHFARVEGSTLGSSDGGIVRVNRATVEGSELTASGDGEVEIAVRSAVEGSAVSAGTLGEVNVKESVVKGGAEVSATDGGEVSILLGSVLDDSELSTTGAKVQLLNGARVERSTLAAEGGSPLGDPGISVHESDGTGIVRESELLSTRLNGGRSQVNIKGDDTVVEGSTLSALADGEGARFEIFIAFGSTVAQSFVGGQDVSDLSLGGSVNITVRDASTVASSSVTADASSRIEIQFEAASLIFGSVIDVKASGEVPVPEEPSASATQSQQCAGANACVTANDSCIVDSCVSATNGKLEVIESSVIELSTIEIADGGCVIISGGSVVKCCEITVGEGASLFLDGVHLTGQTLVVEPDSELEMNGVTEEGECELVTCPPDTEVPCNTSTDPSITGTPTAVPDCLAVTFTFSDEPKPGGILRTWTATYPSGCPRATCVQSITFIDTTPPTIASRCKVLCFALPGDTCALELALPDLTPCAIASDDCGSVTVTQEPPAGTLLERGTHEVMLTATVEAGLTACATVRVNVLNACGKVLLGVLGTFRFVGPEGKQTVRGSAVGDPFCPRGSVQYENVTRGVKVQGIDVTAFGRTGRAVTFAGRAKLNGVKGHSYLICATDGGKPGSKGDTFKIQVFDAMGSLVYSASSNRIESGIIHVSP